MKCSAELEFATRRSHSGNSFIIKEVPLRGWVFIVCVHGWPGLFWPLTLWLWGTWGKAQSANDDVNVWPEPPAHKTCYSKRGVDVAGTHTAGYCTSPWAPESEPLGRGALDPTLPHCSGVMRFIYELFGVTNELFIIFICMAFCIPALNK